MGSTSARIERPGLIIDPGTGMFHELASVPSAIDVGTECDGAAMIVGEPCSAPLT